MRVLYHSLNFAEFRRRGETLLTSAEAHRTDRNPSIGLESSSRYTAVNRYNPGIAETIELHPRVHGSCLRATLEFEAVIEYRFTR